MEHVSRSLTDGQTLTMVEDIMTLRRTTCLSLFALASGVVVGACNRSGDPLIPDSVFGHCIYKNRFSKRTECRRRLW
jgi:hypothetical protein